MFFQLKILSNIVNIEWQSLKIFHRGKLEILRKMGKNDKITALLMCFHGNGLNPENETWPV